MISGANKILAAVGTGLLMAALSACDKSDPTSPSDSTILLSASPSKVEFGNSESATSRIRATVMNKDGRPIAGVVVRFTTNSGTLRSSDEDNETDVETDVNGEAEVILTLTVGDSSAKVTARSGKVSADVTVSVGGQNDKPEAVIVITPTTAKINQPVSFDGTGSTDPQGDETIVFWKWTLDDGSGSPVIIQTDATGTKESFTRSFPTARTIAVQLQVKDDEDALSLIETAAMPLSIVDNFAPTARISPSTLTRRLSDPAFTLSGASSSDDSRDAGGAIVRYDWDMGDASGIFLNNTTPTQTYSYSATGTYTVRLTVYDNGDRTGCDSVTNLCNHSLSGNVTIIVTITL